MIDFIIKQAAMARLENLKLFEKFDKETIDVCIKVIQTMPGVSKERIDDWRNL